MSGRIVGRTGRLLQRHLIMTCSIRRRNTSGVDGDNQPITTYDTAVTGITCKRIEIAEDDLISRDLAGTARFDAVLLFGMGTLLNPLDLVLDIAEPPPGGGTPAVIDPGPYTVREVLDRRDDALQFRRATLVRVGGGPQV